ncbi:MAG: MATE family efflux transporter [Eubacterium sp.]|nr:MATE family efflux transporter [Eubacterium sp.]
MSEEVKNPLGTEPIGRLILKFAVPSIISMLVVSLYNIVDQLFIGRTVGPLGNAATNISFPLTTICVATALVFGIGGASGFNLNMGAGNKEKAMYFAGNAITMMLSVGAIVTIVASIFLSPMLSFFGATDKVLPYAVEYVRIIALGFPFVITSAGGAHLVRGDGSPNFSMACNITGAIINVILDYILVIVLGMGMSGAAIATITGQIVGFIMVVWYLKHFKAGKLKLDHFKPRFAIVRRTAHLGLAQCINQLAMTVVQIALNKSLAYYGALSVYGAEIPLACSGIIMKVGQVYFSFCIGISQGMQPIASFNRGAGKNARVKKTYIIAACAAVAISIVAFTLFQLFPREIIGLFGKGSPEYFKYAEQFFRIFLFMTFAVGIQPITSTFCTAIGEPNKGAFLSLTRQIIFFLPLILVLPVIFTKLGLPGIDGIMFAAPIADSIAVAVCLIMVYRVFKTTLST